MVSTSYLKDDLFTVYIFLFFFCFPKTTEQFHCMGLKLHFKFYLYSLNGYVVQMYFRSTERMDVFDAHHSLSKDWTINAFAKLFHVTIWLPNPHYHEKQKSLYQTFDVLSKVIIDVVSLEELEIEMLHQTSVVNDERCIKLTMQNEEKRKYFSEYCLQN